MRRVGVRADVVLGVGVPFKRFGAEYVKLEQYLKRKDSIYFSYESINIGEYPN